MSCIQTELPSFQNSLATTFSPQQLFIAGINGTSSTAWLQNYRASSGVRFSLIYDGQGTILAKYQVGLSFGNIPPTYVLVDTNGVVQFRTDNKFNQVDTLTNKIRDLLPH